eukprot:11194878-Lingulodinium_polyedra.AAC.1
MAKARAERMVWPCSAGWPGASASRMTAGVCMSGSVWGARRLQARRVVQQGRPPLREEGPLRADPPKNKRDEGPL